MMHESWQTNHNEVNEDVERFEQMESGEKEFYFDIHSIENIFDFYADKNQFDKAERALQIGFKQHPNATQLLAKQAIILIEKGEDEQAIALMETIINLEQSNPEFFLNLGWVYLKNGFFDNGIKCFNKTLETAFDEREEFLLDIAIYLNQADFFQATITYLEPGCIEFSLNENLLFELAFAYDKNENIEKGIETYNRLLDVNPFSENAWYNLGILNIKNKELELAINCYDYALALNPSHADALFNKGNALVYLNSFEKALDCYYDYISYGYDPLLAYHYIADCLDQMDRVEYSLRFYNLAIDTDKNYFPAWLGFISVLINNEMAIDAIKASNDALELSFEYPEIFYLRGRAHLLVDNVEDAKKSFELAFKLDPDNLRHAIELFQITLEHATRYSTYSLWKKWFKKYPESTAVAYIGTWIFLIEKNDFEQAAIHLEKALKNGSDEYEVFIELYPELEMIIKENDTLNQIIYRNLNYEL